MKEDGHVDGGPDGERQGGDEVCPQEDHRALLLPNIVQLRHCADAHCRRESKLDHEHVLVERIRRQEPHLAGSLHHHHPGHRQDHIPHADDRRHHCRWHCRLAHPCCQVPS
uniref:Uncharacterized protein n=1 Tax=Arundo donax TaxID=35708 RepID=A0A0A9H5Q7_ARUDO